MRQGFTLLELVFVLILLTLSSVYTFNYVRQQNFYRSINHTLNDISNILNNAVMDTVKGYVNGTGGDCSNGNNYVGLSAARVIDCIGWSNAYPYKGTKSTNGSESYIVGFSKEYTTSDGCHLYLDNNGLQSDQYYVFIDCSNINFSGNPNKRFTGYVEDKINYIINKNFSTIVQRVDRDAVSLSDKNSGTDNDGKIGFLMKK